MGIAIVLEAMLMAIVVKGDFVFQSNQAPFSIVEQIMYSCGFSPSSIHPLGEDGKKSQTEVKLVFNTLANIDEVEGYVVTTGALAVEFQSRCVQQLTLQYMNNSVTNEGNETITTSTLDLQRWTLTNTDNYWRPPLFHTSSRQDFGLTNNVHWTIFVKPLQGIVRYVASGYFTPTCVFTFYKQVEYNSIIITINTDFLLPYTDFHLTIRFAAVCFN